MSVEAPTISLNQPTETPCFKPGDHVAAYLRSRQNVLYLGKGVIIGEQIPPSHNQIGRLVKDSVIPVALIRTVGDKPNRLVDVWGDEVRLMREDEFNRMIEQHPSFNIRLGNIDFVRQFRTEDMYA